jgi:hypothetical protein
MTPNLTFLGFKLIYSDEEASKFKKVGRYYWAMVNQAPTFAPLPFDVLKVHSHLMLSEY